MSGFDAAVAGWESLRDVLHSIGTRSREGLVEWIHTQGFAMTRWGAHFSARNNRTNGKIVRALGWHLLQLLQHSGTHHVIINANAINVQNGGQHNPSLLRWTKRGTAHILAQTLQRIVSPKSWHECFALLHLAWKAPSTVFLSKLSRSREGVSPMPNWMHLRTTI